MATTVGNSKLFSRVLHAGKQESFTLSRENNWRLCFAEVEGVVSGCCCIHTGREETPPLLFPHKFQLPRETKGWWENQGRVMTKSQRDFPPRSHPFLYASVCRLILIFLWFLMHSIFFFRPRDDSSSGTVLTLSDRKLIHTPPPRNVPSQVQAAFWTKKKRKRISLSKPHATLSLPTTVTYVFISEILSFFCRHFFLLVRCRRFAGVFERPFSRARNQTAFFPHPPST